MMTTRKQSQEQTEATQDKSRGSSCERLTRATLCSRELPFPMRPVSLSPEYAITNQVDEGSESRRQTRDAECVLRQSLSLLSASDQQQQQRLQSLLVIPFSVHVPL